MMAWWKKSRTRRPVEEIDLGLVGGLPLLLACDHKAPFDSPMDCDLLRKCYPAIRELSEVEEQFFCCCVLGYKFTLYFDLIEQRFGKEPSRVAMEYLRVKSDRVPDLQMRRLLAEMGDCVENARLVSADYPGTPLEYLIAIQALLCLSASPLYLSQEERYRLRSITAEEREKETQNKLSAVDKIDGLLAACLIANRYKAIRVFKPIIDNFKIKQDGVGSLNITDNMLDDPQELQIEQVVWSQFPGCFERHLQRRHNNSLFQQNRRRVTRKELEDSRWRDKWEADQIERQVLDVFSQVVDSPDIVPMDSVLDTHKKIIRLIITAAAAGGTATALISKLRHAATILLEAAQRANETFNVDADKAQKAIEHLREAIDDQLVLSANPFVAQWDRRDTPILEEDLLPAILIEDADLLRLLIEMGLLNEEQIIGFGQILDRARAEGLDTSAFQQKIEAAK